MRRDYTPVRAYVIRKSWYYPRFGPYAQHYDKEVRGYTYKPDALMEIEKLNQECKSCPTRTAQSTKYYLQTPDLYVRIKNESQQ